MIAPITMLLWLLSSPVWATDLPPPPQPPQQAATDAIARQIGWLVIENANLRAQIDDLQKQCRIGEPNK